MNERYLTLRAHFLSREHDLECEIRLTELEAIWFCTRKNVKRILRQLEEAGYLLYSPGRGRGNSSKITFTLSFQREIEGYIQECLKHSQLDPLAQILRLPIPKAWFAKSATDIQKMLGFQKDIDSKDVLHSFHTRDITSLDPTKVSVALEIHLIEHLSDTLVKYDAVADCIIPHLAHHYQVDDSKTKWTFFLRKGVFFHNQDYLSSNDVAFTIERVKNGPPSYSWLATCIRKVECVDSHKIILHLEKPNPFFLRLLSAPTFGILPASVPFNEYEWVGTGPFLLKERDDNKLILQANNYYFKERPLLDEIHFYRVSNEAAKTIYFSVNNGEPIKKTSKHIIHHKGFRFLSFNFQRKSILLNVAFREAIFHIFNVRKMAFDLEIDLLEASSFNPDSSHAQSKDIGKVPALLEEANYTGEVLNLFHLNNPFSKKEAEWFASEAKRFGVNIHLLSNSYVEFFQNDLDKKADLLLMGLALSFDKHLAFLSAFKNEALFFNRLFPKDALEKINVELEKFVMEKHKHKREHIMASIEEFMRENHLLVFLYHPIITRDFDSIISNVESHSFGQIDFTKLWISN